MALLVGHLQQLELTITNVQFTMVCMELLQFNNRHIAIMASPFRQIRSRLSALLIRLKTMPSYVIIERLQRLQSAYPGIHISTQGKCNQLLLALSVTTYVLGSIILGCSFRLFIGKEWAQPAHFLLHQFVFSSSRLLLVVQASS